MYDITEEETFEHIKVWLDEISKYAKENVLKVIVGNKMDLDEKRVISYKDGKDLADRFGLPFIETSAKQDNGINDLFEKAALNYIEKLENTNSNTHDVKNNVVKEFSNEDGEKIINLKSRKKNSLLINVDNKGDTGCCK